MQPLRRQALHRRRKSADRFHVIKNLGEAQDGLAGASSGCPSEQPDSGVESHPSLHCATRAAAEMESKGSTAKPGEARGAPGPIPAASWPYTNRASRKRPRLPRLESAMPPSRAGWKVPRFPNNNHGSERLVLTHTCLISLLDGKLAATILLNCIGNW